MRQYEASVVFGRGSRLMTDSNQQRHVQKAKKPTGRDAPVGKLHAKRVLPNKNVGN
jgi:hypothetical protein